MDSMAETINNNHSVDKSIQQLLNELNKQVAIVAHQVDMLQFRHSIGLIRLSLLKLPSKTATLNNSPVSFPGPPPVSRAPPTPPPIAIASAPTPLSTVDVGSKPLASPSPTPPTFVAAAPSYSRPFTQPILQKIMPKTYNRSSLPSQSFHQTPQSPSQLVTNSLTKLISFFHTMSLMKRLEMASESLDKSKLISGYDELNANYEHKMFYFMLERNEENIFGKALFVFDPGGISSKRSRWSTSSVHMSQLSHGSSHGHSVVANRGGTSVTRNPVYNSSINSVGDSLPGILANFVTTAGDPGRAFTVKSIHDLEDKVIFEGSVMIRIPILCHLLLLNGLEEHTNHLHVTWIREAHDSIWNQLQISTANN